MKRILTMIVSFFLIISGTINLVACNIFGNSTGTKNDVGTLKVAIVVDEEKTISLVNIPNTKKPSLKNNDEEIIKVKFSNDYSEVIFTGLKAGKTTTQVYIDNDIWSNFEVEVIEKKIITNHDSLNMVKGSNDVIKILNVDSLKGLDITLPDDKIFSLNNWKKENLLIITALKFGKSSFLINALNAETKKINIIVTEVTSEIIFDGQQEVELELGEVVTNSKVTNYHCLENLSVYVYDNLIVDASIKDGIITINTVNSGSTVVIIKAEGSVTVEINIKVLQKIVIKETTPIDLKIDEIKILTLTNYCNLGEISVSSFDNEIARVEYSEGKITIFGIKRGSVIISVDATYASSKTEIAINVGEVEIKVNNKSITISSGITDKTSLVIENKIYLKKLTVESSISKEDGFVVLIFEKYISLSAKEGMEEIVELKFSAENAPDLLVNVEVKTVK